MKRILRIAWKILARIYPNFETILAKRIDSKKSNFKIFKNSELFNAKKICLFNHYDQHGLLDEYVVHYIKSLKEYGYSIVLISTGLNISGAEQASNLVDVVILRKNIGYDFYSWKIALKIFAKETQNKDILLVNDSVYGPLYDMGNLFRHFTEDAIWGITDSWHYKYHLQSYFLFIPRSVTATGFVHSFFNNVLPYKNKDLIIQKYEIGFTQQALLAGIEIKSLVESHQFIRNRNICSILDDIDLYSFAELPIYCASELILETEVPFIKGRFIKMQNPLGFKNKISWLASVKQRYPEYKVDLIIKHAKRCGISLI